MQRRDFITLLGDAAAAWPLAAHAQQGRRMRRVGILMPFSPSDKEIRDRVQALKEELQNRGWTAGADVQFDERWTTDNMDCTGRCRKSRGVETGCRCRHWRSGDSGPMKMTCSVPIIVPGGSTPVESRIDQKPGPARWQRHWIATSLNSRSSAGCWRR